MINRSNVISNQSIDRHVIESYHFKVISEFSNEPKDTGKQEFIEPQAKKEEAQQTIQPLSAPSEEEAHKEEEAPQEPAFQPSFVEDLLKKNDEMSNNIVKLQMQIESKESEFNARLESELESTKEKFSQEGYEKAKAEFEQELSELKDRYLKSVSKLEEACLNLDNFVEKNEEELAKTAIDIAREVILKELQHDSSSIAYTLAKDSIGELKGAVSIELKVNSADYDYLKEQFASDGRIKISLDDAITKGSVVILSDAGNVESNLNSRLMKLKKMVSNA